jgi:hypothetical protein
MRIFVQGQGRAANKKRSILDICEHFSFCSDEEIGRKNHFIKLESMVPGGIFPARFFHEE